MRTEKSIKNVVIALIGQCFSYILNFVLRMIFIRTLGNEYLGINGLFTNIISIISIVELGFGAAITIFLYKPIAERNTKQISKLILYYAKIYRRIGIIIFCISMGVIPFLSFLIGNVSSNIKEQIIYLYIIFITNSIIPYFFIHFRSIVEANQEKYIITCIHYILNIFLLIMQGCILVVYKNFTLYMFFQLFFTSVENILISCIAKKKYQELFIKQEKELEKREKKQIFRKTKSMSFQLIGNIVLNGTDNIVMSILAGINWVGLYSNYYLIISVIENLMTQIFSAIQASIGNMNAIENKEKKYYIYKVLDFINFWVASFCTISFWIIIDYFIIFWIGTDYVLPKTIIFIITINLYIQLSNKVNTIYKYSSGIIEKDKYASLIGALINIVLSIVLTKWIGVIGIFIGTTISLLTTQTFVEPYILYKYIFNHKYIYKIKTYIERSLFTFFIGLLVWQFTNWMNLPNNIVGIITLIITCIIVVNGSIFILYRNTDEMKYIKQLINKIKIKIGIKILKDKSVK